MIRGWFRRSHRRLLMAIVLVAIGFTSVFPSPAQIPGTTSTTAPTLAPSPQSPVSPFPQPTFSTPAPNPGDALPSVVIPAIPAATPEAVPSPVPATAPAISAPAIPLTGTYTDPAGRFQVGLLPGVTPSPITGNVIMESADGALAYTVVVQSQPAGTPIGVIPGFDIDTVAKVATEVFQRGEEFQPGEPRPEPNGGVVIDWTGKLTIAGNAQPISGTILVRASTKRIVLLLIAATQVGRDRVPATLNALANSLQIL